MYLWTGPKVLCTLGPVPESHGPVPKNQDRSTGVEFIYYILLYLNVHIIIAAFSLNSTNIVAYASEAKYVLRFKKYILGFVIGLKTNMAHAR